MRIRLSVEGGGGRARLPWPMAGPRGRDRQAAPPPPLADRRHRQGTEGPPPLPPPLPHRPESGRGGAPPPPPPPPPPPHPPQLGSHRRGPPPPQGRGGAPTHRRNGDTVRATAAGPAPANPHRRAGATRTTEHEGGRAPHNPPVTTAHSEGTEGGFAGQLGPPGERSTGRPSPPPHPGAALQPRPHARAGRERASDTKRARKGYRRPPPGTRAGRPRRDTPPEARGMPPPPTREGSRSVTRPPAPAAGPHGGREEQASPRLRTGTPHRSYPEKLGEHEPEWYGGPRPPWTAQRQ